MDVALEKEGGGGGGGGKMKLVSFVGTSIALFSMFLASLKICWLIVLTSFEIEW